MNDAGTGANVQISIGCVIVDGAAPQNAARFGQLTERTLSSLLAERGAAGAWRGGRLESVSPPPLDLPAGLSDRRLAAAVAAAIARAIAATGQAPR